MKNAGLLLTIIGGIGLLGALIYTVSQTESFSFLGIDVSVTETNYTPFIIAGVIFIIGLVLLLTSRGK